MGARIHTRLTISTCSSSKRTSFSSTHLLPSIWSYRTFSPQLKSAVTHTCQIPRIHPGLKIIRNQDTCKLSVCVKSDEQLGAKTAKTRHQANNFLSFQFIQYVIRQNGIKLQSNPPQMKSRKPPLGKKKEPKQICPNIQM